MIVVVVAHSTVGNGAWKRWSDAIVASSWLPWVGNVGNNGLPAHLPPSAHSRLRRRSTEFLEMEEGESEDGFIRPNLFRLSHDGTVIRCYSNLGLELRNRPFTFNANTRQKHE